MIIKLGKMGVHESEGRAEAEKDETEKFVKVERVRTKKGDGVQCRFVAQELGYGERPEDTIAGVSARGRHTCHEEGHPQGHGHGREVCVLVRRDPTLGVFRVAARRSPVWRWYDGRNTRCAPDLG